MSNEFKPMTLREYVTLINAVLKKNPKLADLPVITSANAEGNSYDYVPYAPSPIAMDENMEPVLVDDGEEEPEPTHVCLN